MKTFGCHEKSCFDLVEFLTQTAAAGLSLKGLKEVARPLQRVQVWHKLKVPVLISGDTRGYPCISVVRVGTPSVR